MASLLDRLVTDNRARENYLNRDPRVSREEQAARIGLNLNAVESAQPSNRRRSGSGLNALTSRYSSSYAKEAQRAAKAEAKAIEDATASAGDVITQIETPDGILPAQGPSGAPYLVRKPGSSTILVDPASGEELAPDVMSPTGLKSVTAEKANVQADKATLRSRKETAKIYEGVQKDITKEQEEARKTAIGEQTNEYLRQGRKYYLDRVSGEPIPLQSDEEFKATQQEKMAKLAEESRAKQLKRKISNLRLDEETIQLDRKPPTDSEYNKLKEEKATLLEAFSGFGAVPDEAGLAKVAAQEGGGEMVSKFKEVQNRLQQADEARLEIDSLKRKRLDIERQLANPDEWKAEQDAVIQNGTEADLDERIKQDTDVVADLDETIKAESEPLLARDAQFKAELDKADADMQNALTGDERIAAQRKRDNILARASVWEAESAEQRASLNESTKLRNQRVETANAAQQMRQSKAIADRKASIAEIAKTPFLAPTAAKIQALDEEEAKRLTDIQNLPPEQQEAAKAIVADDITKKRAAVDQELKYNTQTVEANIRGLYEKYGKGTRTQDWLTENDPQNVGLLFNLMQDAKKVGLTEAQVRKGMEDWATFDWSNPRKLDSRGQGDFSEETRKFTNGDIIVNPRYLLDEEEYKKVVEKSDATPEAKAKAIANRREQAAPLAARALSELMEDPQMGSWIQSNTKGTPLERMEQFNAKLKDGGALATAYNGFRAGSGSLARTILGAGALATGSNWMTDAATYYGDHATAYAMAQEAAGKGTGTLGRFAGKVAGAVPSLVPAVAIGLATGGLGLGTSASLVTSSLTSGLQSAGGVYMDAYEAGLERGLSQTEARSKAIAPAIVSGLITSTLTQLGGARGVESLFKTATPEAVKAGLKATLANIATNAGEEALEEFSDQALQGLLASATYTPEKSIEQALTEAVEAGLVGMTLGGGIAAIKGTGGKAEPSAPAEGTTPPTAPAPEVPGVEAATAPTEVMPEVKASLEAIIKEFKPDVATLPQAIKASAKVAGVAKSSQDAARAILAVAQGQALDTLPSGLLESVGLTRTDKGIVAKEKKISPLIEIVKGQPVIRNEAIDWLEQNGMDLLREQIGKTEGERLAEINAPETLKEAAKPTEVAPEPQPEPTTTNEQATTPPPAQPETTPSAEAAPKAKKAVREAATKEAKPSRPALGKAPPAQRKAIGKGAAGGSSFAEFASITDADAFAYAGNQRKATTGRNLSNDQQKRLTTRSREAFSRIQKATGIPESELRGILAEYSAEVRKMAKSIEAGKSFQAPTLQEFIKQQSSSANRTVSWVVKNKQTGEVLFETNQKSVADKIDTSKYETVPIGQYLASINGQSQSKTLPPASQAQEEGSQGIASQAGEGSISPVTETSVTPTENVSSPLAMYDVYPYGKYWAVMLNEKGDNFGNSLFDSKEEAQDFARIQKSLFEDRQALAEKEKKQADIEAEKQKQKDAPLEEYFDATSQSKLQRGKLKAALDVPVARRSSFKQKIYNGSRAEVIRDMIADGFTPVTRQVPALKELTGSQLNRMDNRQFADYERRKKQAGEKPEYVLTNSDGGEFSITKVEYDYAKWLIDSQNQPVIETKTQEDNTPSGKASSALGITKDGKIVKDSFLGNPPPGFTPTQRQRLVSAAKSLVNALAKIEKIKGVKIIIVDDSNVMADYAPDGSIRINPRDLVAKMALRAKDASLGPQTVIIHELIHKLAEARLNPSYYQALWASLPEATKEASLNEYFRGIPKDQRPDFNAYQAGAEFFAQIIEARLKGDLASQVWENPSLTEQVMKMIRDYIAALRDLAGLITDPQIRQFVNNAADAVESDVRAALKEAGIEEDFLGGKKATPAKPRKADTPTQALEKVADQVDAVTPRTAKAVKADIIAELEKAIKESNPTSPRTLIFQIPGDGKFTLINTRANLEKLLTRVKRLPIDDKPTPAPSETGGPNALAVAKSIISGGGRSQLRGWVINAMNGDERALKVIEAARKISKATVEQMEKAVQQEFGNAPLSAPPTVYRAGDATETGIKPFASYTEEINTAKAYLDNPGFGGPTLREISIPDDLNVFNMGEPSPANFKKLAVALGFDSDVGQDWFDNGWQYPWEESSKVKNALADSEFDAVRYTDDFPAGAKTIIFTRVPQSPLSAPPSPITPAQDAEYLAAVESGNLEKAQKMVDDAAKAAGYNVGPVKHGTATEFTEFDSKFGGKMTEALSAKSAFFLVDDDKTAMSYAVYAAEDGPVKDALAKADAAEKRGDWDAYDKFTELAESLDSYDSRMKLRKNAKIINAYIKGDFLEFDAKGKTPQELHDGDIDAGISAEIKKAKKQGKTGVVYRNLDDAVNLTNRPATHYAVFKPSQIKSADVVTRDAHGNIIPLSQRFNAESNSILYAPLPPESLANAAYQPDPSQPAPISPDSDVEAPSEDDDQENVRRALEDMEAYEDLRNDPVAMKALQEQMQNAPEGKLTPDPKNRALMGLTPETRAAQQAALVAQTQNGIEVQRQAAVFARAREAVATNRAAVELSLFEKMANEALFDMDDHAMAQQITEKMQREITLNPGDSNLYYRYMLLTNYWADNKTNVARSLAIMRDPQQTPLDRMRQSIAVVGIPPLKVRMQIRAAWTPKEKSAQIKTLEKQLADVENDAQVKLLEVESEKQDTITRIKAEYEAALAAAKARPDKEQLMNSYIEESKRTQAEILSKMQLSNDDVMLNPEDRYAVRQSVMDSPGVKAAMAKFSAEQRAAVNLAVNGYSDAEIAKRTGFKPDEVAKIAENFRQNILKPAIAAEVKAGKTFASMLQSGFEKLKNILRAPITGEFDQLTGQGDITAQNATAIAAEIDRILDFTMQPARRRNRPGSLVAKVIQTPNGQKVRMFIPFDPDDARAFYRYAREMSTRDASGFDKVYEYWINGILSGPQTQVANIAGNLGQIAWHYTAQRSAEAILNIAYNDPKTARLGEFPHVFKAFYQAVAPAWNQAMLAWDTEADNTRTEYLNEPLTADFKDSNLDKVGGQRSSIQGKKGRIIRIPGRALRFFDSLFKTAVLHAEASAIAYREGRQLGLKGQALEAHMQTRLDQKGNSVWQEAMTVADDLLFQSDNWATMAVESIVKSKNIIGPRLQKGLANAEAEGDATAAGNYRKAIAVANFVQGVMRFLFPFTRTPTNILRVGVRKSGGAAISGLFGITNGLWQVYKGKPFTSSYSKAEQVKDLSETFLAGLAWATLAGMAEGDDDDDKKMILMVGNRPYGAGSAGEKAEVMRKYGGTQVVIFRNPSTGEEVFRFNYGRYEPFATAMGVMVDTMREIKQAGKSEEGIDSFKLAGSIVSHLMAQAESKSFLQGLAGIARTTEQIRANQFEPGPAAGKFIITSIVPNLIRQSVRNADDLQRDYKSGWKHEAWPSGRFAEPVIGPAGEPVKKGGNVLSRLAFQVPNVPSKPTSEQVLQQYNLRNPANRIERANLTKAQMFAYKADNKTRLPLEDPKDKRAFTALYERIYAKRLREKVAELPMIKLPKPPFKVVDEIKEVNSAALKEAREKFLENKLVQQSLSSAK